jgi:hypothetical protein
MYFTTPLIGALMSAVLLPKKSVSTPSTLPSATTYPSLTSGLNMPVCVLAEALVEQGAEVCFVTPENRVYE